MADVPWTLTREDVGKYDGFFGALDTSGRGAVDRAQALPFFGHAGLPPPALELIWALSSRGAAVLSRADFRVAMHLTALAARGVPIPQALPAALSRSAGAEPPLGAEPQAGAVHAPGPAVTAWTLTSADVAKYDAYFGGLDTARRGFVDRALALPLFARSSLPPASLDAIWALAARSGSVLSKIDFRIAMHLTMQAAQGVALPAAVPPALAHSAGLAPAPTAPQPAVSPGPASRAVHTSIHTSVAGAPIALGTHSLPGTSDDDDFAAFRTWDEPPAAAPPVYPSVSSVSSGSDGSMGVLFDAFATAGGADAAPSEAADRAGKDGRAGIGPTGAGIRDCGGENGGVVPSWGGCGGGGGMGCGGMRSGGVVGNGGCIESGGGSGSSGGMSLPGNGCGESDEVFAAFGWASASPAAASATTPARATPASQACSSPAFSPMIPGGGSTPAAAGCGGFDCSSRAPSTATWCHASIGGAMLNATAVDTPPPNAPTVLAASSAPCAPPASRAAIPDDFALFMPSSPPALSPPSEPSRATIAEPTASLFPDGPVASLSGDFAGWTTTETEISSVGDRKSVV